MITHPPAARRRLVAATVGLVLLSLTVSACQGTWGIRSSYRSYVTGPAGDGSITPGDGAGWQDGPGTGKGPFTWPVDWATFDAATEIGTVQMKGSVETKAHPIGDIHALETTFWNPRLEIDGDTGTLHVDLTYRPFTGIDPDPIPAVQSALDVPFATVDLSGVTWTADANGNRTITGAPMVGIPAAMERIGWDDFYGPTVTLDPLTVTFNATTFAPTVAAEPTLAVSQTEGLRPGDTIAVWGTGFDPAAHVGTRPPLSGQPSGAYVVFGRFAATWQPSSGAPSSARTVIAQRWGLPQTQHLALDPAQTNPSFIRIDAFGRFEALLTVGAGGTTGSYGVATYPGSGAVNPEQELLVPVDLLAG
jgi:hypothetical protein